MLRSFNAFIARRWDNIRTAFEFAVNLPIIFHILVVLIALIIGVGSAVWSVIVSVGLVLRAIATLLWAPFKALFVIGGVIADGWTSPGF
ncbi:hypothetical protein [Ralstonia phage phiITL-1]|uniref:Uncharacterized protein n=1 Tax=Ralstonia phage phiITL-1 TaxID=1597967 RepID=A0A0U1ZD50_9CAUD|nr:hypothetical protein HOR02_gp21 [Ralstonia phage phiITL-1]AJT60805.1 hypothetical protein [Ralstonia phage phiITL-1]